MDIIIILNIIALVTLTLFLTVILYKYIQAERKLAKHGESELFKDDKGENQ